MSKILAAADIGSNTAHLLVASSDGFSLERIVNRNDWIALGEVVARHGVVPPTHATRLVSTLKTFRNAAGKALAEGIYVFATEAMRSARNHAEVIRRIREATKLQVDLISPEREAWLSLRGVSLDTPRNDAALLFEVGGGSVQVAYCEHGELVKDVSIPIGTGRLIALASMRNPCPPDVQEHAERLIQSALGRLEGIPCAPLAVASGGVGRGLWRALHPDGERKLVLEEIDYIAWSVSRLTPELISARYGVRQKRAETMLAGALVFRALLRRFGLREMLVSEYGVREGAVLEMAEGRIKPRSL
jgi:exopolyphosphatase/guanosine-5'-triphosphate,3'-diphosphate pyrophosphatase